MAWEGPPNDHYRAARELEAPKTTRPFKGEQLEIEKAWTNQLHLSLPSSTSKFQHV